MNRLPVLERTYDLLKWLVRTVSAFPKSQRYLLGERMEGAALDLLDLLVEARVSPSSRRDCLRRAGIRVDRLRLLLRLSHDLGLLAGRRYEHGARVLDEVGRQVGGWLHRGTGSSAPADGVGQQP